MYESLLNSPHPVYQDLEQRPEAYTDESHDLLHDLVSTGRKPKPEEYQELDRAFLVFYEGAAKQKRPSREKTASVKSEPEKAEESVEELEAEEPWEPFYWL